MTISHPGLDALCEDWLDEYWPETERFPQTGLQKQWARDGFVIVKGLLDDALIEDYELEWMGNNSSDFGVMGDVSTYLYPHGFDGPVSYARNPAMRSLATQVELSDLMYELIGEDVGLHLTLTGWVSTRRDWHFDQYLNDPEVGAHYVAAWMCLKDVTPDSGPFQFVAGSHRMFRPMSRQKVIAALAYDKPDWPSRSEQILSPIFEQIIQENDLEVTTYLPKRGDVLLWHSMLLHRGSKPERDDIERRALIAHYTAISKRPYWGKPEGGNGSGYWWNLSG